MIDSSDDDTDDYDSAETLTDDDTDTIVEDDEQEEENSKNLGRKERISGNAIVELKYMTNTILRAQHLHKSTCSGRLVLHDNNTAAFRNYISLKCRKCGEVSKCTTVSPDKENDLAKSFYMGTAAAGLTFETSRQLLSVMDVKACTYPTFAEKAEAVEPALEDITEEIMDDAIHLEMAIAVSKAQVDKDGCVCISVIIDGAWNKRSFGHGHSASSGAAVIIGAETGLVLWVGSKNRRCKACDYGNISHKCYCNWNGPPGTMEAALIVEAFNSIFAKYKLKFTQVVGDGDSSVFNMIKEKVTYSTQIEKIQCTNHTKKNFKKAMFKLEKNTAFSTATRQILSTYRDKFVYRLQFVVKHCADNGGTDVSNLKKDILEIMNHVGDCHQNCRLDVCPEAGNTNAIAREYEILKNSPLHDELLKLLRELSSKANRLRLNMNTNFAEGMFSGLNKLNSGKRVDLAARGEFSRRVMMCAANWNTSNWILEWYREATGNEPGFNLVNYVDAHIKRRNYDKARQRPPKKKKHISDEGYGENADTTLMELVTDQEIGEMRDKYKKDSSKLEMMRTKTSLDEREEFMQGRIEAHHIPDIIKTRSDSGFDKKIARISSKAANSEYLNRNVVYVDQMREIINAKLSSTFESVGTILHPNMNYICCCPDGITSDSKSVLFIENVKLKKGRIREQAVSDKKFVLGYQDGRLILNDKDLYRKAQAAMQICGSSSCVITFVNDIEDFATVTVEKDTSFWPLFEDKINRFFEEFVKLIFVQNIEIN
ncbi:uncharacterized protein LOC128092545 [Culex pipiens pallens]|uniref:uncharacterized protein LOC128092545 n=1 Tax=Culex pipiens pallens TaxID=42434 RepID=UPI0022AAB0CE|nr:uncharacterized protein LOC128092545 [Culex pipiens pallens]